MKTVSIDDIKLAITQARLSLQIGRQTKDVSKKIDGVEWLAMHLEHLIKDDQQDK